MKNGFYSAEKDSIILSVKVVPGSSKSEIKGISGGHVRIRIAAAPENNRANEELISFLAGIAGCAKKEIAILGGEKSRIKTIMLPKIACTKKDGLIDIIERIDKSK